MMWPTMKIPTSVGDMVATITGDNHVHLEGLVTVRGVQYNASVHLYVLSDGDWGLNAVHGAGAYIHRGSGFSKGEASDSAKAKIVEAFKVAWVEAARGNPNVIRQAQRLRHEEDCHRLSEKLTEARKVVATLEAELKTAREGIATLDRMAEKGPYAFDLKAP